MAKMFSSSIFFVEYPFSSNFFKICLSFFPVVWYPSKCLYSNNTFLIFIELKSISLRIVNSLPSTSINNLSIWFMLYLDTRSLNLIASIKIFSISSSSILNLFDLWSRRCCLLNEPIPLDQCFFSLCIDVFFTK